MYQEKSSSPHTQKHLSHFWVTLFVFILAGILVLVLTASMVGTILPVICSIVFSVAVYNLPQVISHRQKRLRRLRVYCTAGSVIVFACFVGIILIEALEKNNTYHFEYIRGVQCVIIATYLATSAIISKRFDKDERHIENLKEKSHTHNTHTTLHS